jgi:hypothetical protein
VKTASTLALLASALWLTGCATKFDNTPNGPPPYKEGFAAGCNSGYVATGNPYYQFTKDPVRYESDALYKQG